MNYLHLKIIIISLLLKLTVSYRTYTLQELCPSNQLKKVFQIITNIKETINLGTGENSSIIVHQSWNSSSFKKFKDCTFKVDVGNKENKPYRGLYVSVQKVNLRREEDSKENCIDYVKFKFDNGTRTKLCGKYGTITNDYENTFFDDPAGIIEVFVSIDQFLPLDNVDDTLDISIVFTAYGACIEMPIWPEPIMCIPLLVRTCISHFFYMDHINNCPAPYCRDELECTPKKERVKVSSISSTNIIISAVSSLIITMMVVCCCLWMCWKLYFKDSNRRTMYDHNCSTLVSPTLSPSPPIQNIQIELPTSMDDVSVAGQIQPHEQQQQQRSNEDNTVVEKDLPPSYESLFPINAISIIYLQFGN